MERTLGRAVSTSRSDSMTEPSSDRIPTLARSEANFKHFNEKLE